jgi:energy-coupling factor transport system substrate-specific component
VIGLAEAFDSMTSEHSYRESVPRAEALARIREGSGTQFDPRVVTAIERLAETGDLDRIA